MLIGLPATTNRVRLSVRAIHQKVSYALIAVRDGVLNHTPAGSCPAAAMGPNDAAVTAAAAPGKPTHLASAAMVRPSRSRRQAWNSSRCAAMAGAAYTNMCFM